MGKKRAVRKKYSGESFLWKAFRYVLASGARGPIETLRIIKLKKSSIVHKEYPDEEPEVHIPVKGEIKNNPQYNDFRVEKEFSGNYPIFRKRLYQDSKIILIFGKRGSGKSALGLRVMENIRAKANRKCYTLGINEKFLPTWIKSIAEIEEAETESIILVDEGAISFNARESMSGNNKELSKIMAIARHKNLTLLFITQNTGMIDKNILKLADSLMIKEGSLLQVEMERSEIKKFYEKAKKLFDNIGTDKIKHFYLIDADFEGLLQYSLPSFWTTELSKNMKSAKV